jgi:hypothetical protein
MQRQGEQCCEFESVHLKGRDVERRWENGLEWIVQDGVRMWTVLSESQLEVLAVILEPTQ